MTLNSIRNSERSRNCIKNNVWNCISVKLLEHRMTHNWRWARSNVLYIWSTSTTKSQLLDRIDRSSVSRFPDKSKSLDSEIEIPRLAHKMQTLFSPKSKFWAPKWKLCVQKMHILLLKNFNGALNRPSRTLHWENANFPYTTERRLCFEY